jgi:hypothetical protein
MKCLRLPNGTIEVTLSRRNALVLLSKLDQNEPTLATIYRRGDGADEPTVIVTIEEDEVHYRERTPGVMHVIAENRVKTGWTPKG